MFSPVCTESGSIGRSQHCSSVASCGRCFGADLSRTESRSAERIASEAEPHLKARSANHRHRENWRSYKCKARTLFRPFGDAKLRRIYDSLPSATLGHTGRISLSEERCSAACASAHATSERPFPQEDGFFAFWILTLLCAPRAPLRPSDRESSDRFRASARRGR